MISRAARTLLKALLLATDIGFVVYWLVTLLHLIPVALLFKDYSSPALVAWNWSFLPLDLLISLTGFLSLRLSQKGSAHWQMAAVVSLTLTSLSGLMALSFWTLRRDFSWEWWLPNLFLLLYPLPFFLVLSQETRPESQNFV